MTLPLLNEAAALINVGKPAEAQKLLELFLEANPHNIPAWLLEVETWPTVTGKKKVLELCLRHNPDAPQVKQRLAALESGPSLFSTAGGGQPSTSPGVNPTASVLSRKKARSLNRRAAIILGGVLLVVAGLLGWVYLTSAGCNALSGTEPCSRILFIGNSYTYVNDLPGMFAQLARSGGYKVEVQMAAPGGWALAQHANAAETLDKLKSEKWDFVVLQEQSQIPAIGPSRTQSMYPAARELVQQIEALGARPIFFMTWAHRDGWPENGLPNYETMQTQIEQGYLSIARELNTPVAPVGEAWFTARRQNPELSLWQSDGSHPSEPGTYLAACVFYAVIFRHSPLGFTYTAHLSKDVAQVLQAIAAEVVLKNPTQWNLN